MSQLVTFKIILAILALLLLFFQIAIWRRLRVWVQKTKFKNSIRRLYFTTLFFSQSILWIGVFYPGRGMGGAYPEWYIPIHKILLAINYSHLFWILPLAFIWLLGFFLKKIFSHKNTKAIDTDTKPCPTLSREEFLRKAAGATFTGINLLPAASSIAAISGMFLGSYTIWLNEKQIRIKNLHDDLKGLRIAQISDIHIGNLIHEKYLSAVVDTMRNAKLDYIFVTGDIIDNNNLFLPTAGKFIADLQKLLPWGHILGIMGNHDFIDNGEKASQSYGDAGMNVLRNEFTLLKRGKGILQVVGLDYPPITIKSRMAASKKYFNTVKKNLREENPTIVLNHHPSDFGYLKNEKVDLVLSGHTHGGQIVLSKNRDSLLNCGGWLYKYYVDLYEENGVQLNVNRGLGHWFPLRIDCPPEITVFTLT
ncbi:MAG: 3',5'-cyclic adenosine monophosphate phosphodiesterase CpdA [Turneriella sp.]|nr:3',5'-cyclic adenosine monophosphate phosphodiesterase CpdA [Turneriella sp.]